MKKISFELSPEDIAESFGVICAMLGLDKLKEQTACLGKNKKIIDYTVLLKLSIKYQLNIALDFKKEKGSIEFIPVSEDIKDMDDYVAIQDEEAKVEEAKMLEELKNSKELPKAEKQGVDEMDDDDF